VGAKLSQADVTVACVLRFLRDALGVNREAADYAALAELAARCERLPAFEAVPVEPFHAPG
jgi:glutathione S-transferase